jgi:hypothetical protein
MIPLEDNEGTSMIDRDISDQSLTVPNKKVGMCCCFQAIPARVHSIDEDSKIVGDRVDSKSQVAVYYAHGTRYCSAKDEADTSTC